MARVKLTEYRAKRLVLGEDAPGSALRSGTPVSLPDGAYVVKVDQGIKKRMKRGLVALQVAPEDIAATIAPWEAQGFSSFIAEPMLPHEESEERYVSFERVRDGIRVLYAKEGGIDIEEHPEKVERFLITDETSAGEFAASSGIPLPLIERIRTAFSDEHLSFLEINPLVVRGEKVFLLDAAALVDSAGAFFAKGWGDEDIVRSAAKHPAEAAVEALAATTPASLRLSVLNKDGSLFFLLSGGGGSIVIADEAAALSMGNELGNYGEYSGGPTREETYLYAREVIGLMLASKAPKKALVIAGGVANFTDVKATFAGVIDALHERVNELQQNSVRVFVRRGGPNEAEGLALMRSFLEEANIAGTVSGSDAVITEAVDDAIAYLKS